MNHKIMRITVARGLGTDKLSPLMEKLLIVNGFWGRRDHFALWACITLVGWPYSSVPVPYPGGSGQCELDLVGYHQKQDTKLEGVAWVWKKLGKIGENRIKIHHMKLSQNEKYFFKCMFKCVVEDGTRYGLWKAANPTWMPQKIQQDIEFTETQAASLNNQT